MRLDVLIASRGNPAGLETAIRVMRALESGQNDIRYLVGVDEDDPTIDIPDLGYATIVSIAPRPVCFGAVWNRLAAISDAEYMMIMGDDQICLTQYWDTHIMPMMGKDLMCAATWIFAPTIGGLAFIHRKFYEAMGNTIYTEMIPYWFTDRWLQEIYEFTFGQKLKIYQNIVFGGKESKTKNMRDLDFWWGFYNATRMIRRKEAREIAKKLGYSPSWDVVNQIAQQWDAEDLAMRPRIQALEDHFRSEQPMSQHYTTALANAKLFLSDNNLTPWKE